MPQFMANQVGPAYLSSGPGEESWPSWPADPRASSRSGGPMPAPTVVKPDLGPGLKNKCPQELQMVLDRCCLQCKFSKAKCNMNLPCSRCAELNLNCLPQCPVAPRRRPPKVAKADTGSSPKNEAMQQDWGDSSSVSPPDAPLSGDDAAMMPEKTSIRRAVDTLHVTFVKMDAEGHVDDSRAVGLLKAWAATQRRFNKDFTMGLSSLILSLMGPRALGLLVKADPNIDPNQQLHDGSGNVLDRRFLPYFIKELDDSTTFVTASICYDGRWTIYSNERFASTFMTAEEIDFKLHRFGVLPCIVWCSCLDPEEIPRFYSQLMAHLFSQAAPGKELSIICKCIDRHGVSFIGLMRFRNVVMESGYEACILSVYPLPKSRHIGSPMDSDILLEMSLSLMDSKPSSMGNDSPSQRRVMPCRSIPAPPPPICPLPPPPPPFSTSPATCPQSTSSSPRSHRSSSSSSFTNSPSMPPAGAPPPPPIQTSKPAKACASSTNGKGAKKAKKPTSSINSSHGLDNSGDRSSTGSTQNGGRRKSVNKSLSAGGRKSMPTSISAPEPPPGQETDPLSPETLQELGGDWLPDFFPIDDDIGFAYDPSAAPSKPAPAPPSSSPFMSSRAPPVNHASVSRQGGDVWQGRVVADEDQMEEAPEELHPVSYNS